MDDETFLSYFKRQNRSFHQNDNYWDYRAYVLMILLLTLLLLLLFFFLESCVDSEKPGFI